MTQKSINYSKVAAVLGVGTLIAAIAAPAYFASNADNGLDEIQIQEAMQKAIALQSFDINVTDSPMIIAINEEIFQEDAFEEESKIIARDELEERDYRELARHLGIDRDDIRKVTVRDTMVDITNLNDKDSEVEFELRVSYEDNIGVDLDLRRYITAIVTIEDGEVEDIEFFETD